MQSKETTTSSPSIEIPKPKSCPSPSKESASPKIIKTSISPKSNKTADIHKVLKKAFALNEKTTTSSKASGKVTEFDVKDYLSDDQLKDIFSKEAQQMNINCDLEETLAEKPSQLLNSMELLKSLAAPPLRKNEVMVESDESDQDFEDDDDEEEEEYVEFKFAPRPIYMSTICQVSQ